jgi:single-stranded DNA-binding protein
MVVWFQNFLKKNIFNFNTNFFNFNKMNYRIVDGRLTKNAEVRVNKNNGKKFLSFTLANNGFARGEQITTYFNVISYNDYDISRPEAFTQGKLVVVTGRPDEVLTVKDGKTYLNRNITAYSIETGTPTGVKENATTTYRDVAPAPVSQQIVPQAPMCETPQMAVVSAPTAPTVATPVLTNPTSQTNIGQTYQAKAYDVDDLPF